MGTRNHAREAVISLLLLTVIGIGIWISMHRPTAVRASAWSTVEDRSKPSDARVATPVVQIRTEPFRETNATTLLVTDTDGQAIPGALIIPGTVDERRIPGSRPPLARTTAVGEARLPESLPTDPTARLLISSPGYVPIGIAVPERGTTNSIMLRRGVTQEFRCVDERGRPLSGVSLALSRIAPDTDEYPTTGTGSAETWVPGFDELGCVHSATSDEDGCATISGLAPGDYQYDVVDPLRLPIREEPILAVDVGADPVVIVLSVPIGFVLGVADDVLSDYAVRSRAAGQLPGTRWHLAVLRERLKARFPGKVVWVGSPDPSDTPTPCSVTLFTESYCGTTTVSPAPLVEPIAPIFVERADLVGVERTGRVTVEVVTPDGTRHAGWGLTAETRSLEGRHTFDIVSSRQSALPPGVYSLGSRWLKFRDKPGYLTIVAGIDTAVELPVDAVPVRCRLELRSSSGIRICRSAVVVTSDRIGPIFTGGPSPIDFFVPAAARIKVRVHAFGFEEQTETFAIEPAEIKEGAVQLKMVLR